MRTERRQILSLAGQIDHTNFLDPIQRWETWLWGERNGWDVARRQLPRDADEWLAGGGWARGRLSKNDAAKLLGLAFAAIDGAGQ